MAQERYFVAPCKLFLPLLNFGYAKKPEWDNIFEFSLGDYMVNRADQTKTIEEQFEDAKGFFCVTTRNTPKDILTTYKKYVYQNSKKKKEPTFALPVNKWFEIRDSETEIDDTRLILMFAYMALKSIQGKRNFALSSNSLWLSRISCSSKVVKKYHTKVKPYGTIYKCRKLRALMEKYYKVVFYIPQGARGFYFSTSKDLTADMIKDVLEQRRNEKTKLPP